MFINSQEAISTEEPQSFFRKRLSQENRLLEWAERINSIENEVPVNEEKLINALQELTKTFAHNESFNKNSWFIKQWFKLVERIADDEVVLEYMDENGIGAQLSFFYEAYAIKLEKKRKFKAASDILLIGKERGAQPIESLEECIRKFESRMNKRLKRDFYDRGLYLPRTDDQDLDSELVQINYYNNIRNRFIPSNKTSQDEMRSKKRRNPFEEEIKDEYKQDNLERVNLKKKKLEEPTYTVNSGAFSIFVDEPFRSVIPAISKIVNDYISLCLKHNYNRQIESSYDLIKHHKSWISYDMEERRKEKDLILSYCQEHNEEAKMEFKKDSKQIFAASICAFESSNYQPIKSNSSLPKNSINYKINDNRIKEDEFTTKILDQPQNEKSVRIYEEDCEYVKNNSNSRQFKKTPFQKDLKSHHTTDYVTEVSPWSDNFVVKTEVKQNQNLNPSLNISRSLNFDEDCELGYGGQLSDSNIDKFNKSPICKEIFGEDFIRETGNLIKNRRINKPRKIECLRSSHIAHDQVVSEQTTRVLPLPIIKYIKSNDNEQQDEDFVLYMEKILRSPVATSTQQKTISAKKALELCEKILDKNILEDRVDPNDGGANEDRTNSPGICFEDDKENLVPSMANSRYMRTNNNQRKILSELPIEDFIRSDSRTIAFNDDNDNDVSELVVLQSTNYTDEENLNMHNNTNKTTFGNNTDLWECSQQPKCSKGITSNNILKTECGEDKEATTCDLFLSSLFGMKDSKLPSRDKRGLSSITEYSRESDVSGVHGRNSFSGIHLTVTKKHEN